MSLEGARTEAPPRPATAPASAEQALSTAFREHHAGRLEAAVAWYRQALEIHPNFVEAINNFGIALKDLGRFEEASAAYRRAIALRPDLAEIWNNLGDCLHCMQDRRGAIENYRRAVEIKPEYALAWRNLGDALSERGELMEAEICFRKAIAYAPDLDPSLSPSEIGVRTLQRSFAAQVLEIEAASKRDPLFASAYHDCGAGRGPPPGSDKSTVERYRLAEKFRNGYASNLSALLGTLQYDATASPVTLWEGHGECERLYSDLPRFTSWSNTRDPDRRLRIGYVSADFRQHSVAYFLAALFRAHHSAAFEICCYYTCADEDEETVFFKKRADRWRSIVDLPYADLAELIRADGIDILVDLSGHTAGNRLGVFARHPAPVQVSWLGYPDTTGLSAIDYRLTDTIADPPGVADRLTSERLWRLPDSFHCYTAPPSAPDVAPLPAAQAGFITFGSFNNLVKVTQNTLDLWAATLKRVPGSRLLVKSKWLGIARTRQRVLNLLARRGVTSDRVELMGRVPAPADHLATYARVDIALDTFPYNGTTTTCEALWMGVPVVTLAGDRHAARVGASLVSQVGLADLVATTADAYVEAAARLAADQAGLACLRAGLRARMAGSTLCDADRFTRNLEHAYRTMWRDWCRASGA